MKLIKLLKGTNLKKLGFEYGRGFGMDHNGDRTVTGGPNAFIFINNPGVNLPVQLSSVPF